MNIVVCVGSSCYSKGSCSIARGFQKLIQKYDLNDVTVSASFCMGHCSQQGVSVKINGEFVNGVTAENVEEVFAKYVLSPVTCLSR